MSTNYCTFSCSKDVRCEYHYNYKKLQSLKREYISCIDSIHNTIRLITNEKENLRNSRMTVDEHNNNAIVVKKYQTLADVIQRSINDTKDNFRGFDYIYGNIDKNAYNNKNAETKELYG
jgi:hypothetical protein